MQNGNSTARRPKPRLSFWQIWNMSFGFLGIQFGFALQNANVSRIFETLGAKIDDIPILWVAAPLTGLIIQPIVGYFSDRTWNRLGRRRPYFLAGALLASTALFIMPNSPVLWFAAGMLWIMDASINISMEPFRAFVGDNLPDEQRTSGFAMQSFFIGVGAVVASMLPYMLTNWFGVSNEASEGVIPDSVKWSFYLGGSIFLLAVLWTVFRSFEYPPEELASFSDSATHQTANLANLSQEEKSHFVNRQIRLGSIFLLIGGALTIWFFMQMMKKDLYILAIGLMTAGLLFILAGLMQKNNNESGFVTMMNDLLSMPKTMGQLALVQFFSWFALFSMWIYTTAAVTSHIYGTSDTTSKEYNDGADWVGVCFGMYSAISAYVAFLIPALTNNLNKKSGHLASLVTAIVGGIVYLIFILLDNRQMMMAGKALIIASFVGEILLFILSNNPSRKATHIACLLLGAIGLVSIYYLKNAEHLLFSMIGIGFAWASILSMPYAILTGALPSDKMGYYMGVFNFFIVIPQIVAAAILGFFIANVFDHQAINAMFIGGISFVVAAVMTFFVEDKKG